ncbi:MAB_1171c family putative transporter [Streptomyces alkaliterrae]|uniref:DUF6545 domain-containing protein n=1 Tax=Streptomyces alkaliterrae TaxID=2213162 RepID=A0A5P0YRA4_9ACTN|nr:MAB_1171c family putative transporter [Streptomyces alkaliterrae]MBB1255310.1 hypothetical protein [Streptomyces alkaliterrae]MBB1259999.1 hypothetical protein [Streptomyces alkaliterrae]MQS02861.1 hypothetical protein [Streptomyces alkaliterrae]
METRHIVEYGVLALLWGMVLWRAPAAWRAPGQRMLWLTFAALTVSMTLRLPAVMHAIDEGTGVNNLSTLCKHFFGIIAAAALLEFVFGITRPGSRQGVRLRFGAALGTLLALTVLFAVVPRDVAAERFYETHAGSPAATAYLLVWYAYLGTAMAVATSLFLGAARQAEAGWLRTGLRLLGAGTAAGVLYAMLRVGYLLLRLVGVAGETEDPVVTDTTDLLKHAAILLILLGTAIPAWGIGWRGLRQARHLSRLRRLWTELTEAVPEVVLDEELRRGEMRLRLHRRVVEIRDAILALQPYTDDGLRDAAWRTAERSGAEGERLRALADACWVETARNAKLAGRPPYDAGRDAERREEPTGRAEAADDEPVIGALGDLDSEARWLCLLDEARQSETVRAFVSAAPARAAGPVESENP